MGGLLEEAKEPAYDRSSTDAPQVDQRHIRAVKGMLHTSGRGWDLLKIIETMTFKSNVEIYHAIIKFLDLLSMNDKANLEREKQTLMQKLKDTEEQLQGA